MIVCLLLLTLSTIEHACESGEQLPVGVQMEAYGDQAAAAGNQYAAKSRKDPSRKSGIANIERSGTLGKDKRP